MKSPKVQKQPMRFWHDADGKLVIWQTPNLPLITWVGATILSWILSSATLVETASIIAFGALFTWSWLEISSGASYFRRLLGAGVLILIITNRLSA